MDNAAQVAALIAQLARLGDVAAEHEVAAEAIEAKIVAGKIKADGPKAKEARLSREYARLYHFDAAKILARIDLLTKPVEELTPEGIDTVLFPLWAERWTYAGYLAQARQIVSPKTGVYESPALYQAREAAKLALEAEHLAKFGTEHWDAKARREAIALHEAKLAEIQAAIAPYEAEYTARGGWTRYILCGNNNGHLHYQGCHTLRFDTETLLVPQASGLQADEVVGKFGKVSCSKCFTGAPV